MRERKHLTVKVSETNKCTRNPCEIFGHSMKRQKKKGEKRTREEKERLMLKSFKKFQNNRENKLSSTSTQHF